MQSLIELEGATFHAALNCEGIAVESLDAQENAVVTVALRNTTQRLSAAKHEIHVRGTGEEIQSAAVFDVLGHEVMHLGHSLPQQEFILPLADLPQGLYIVHCTDVEGNTSTMKFIKE